jgi:hypothetical protein
VHGAISARLSLGIAASRDSTRTGLRPISGSSHHQTSPLDGRGGVLMSWRLRHGTRRDHPMRLAPRVDAGHRQRKTHRSHRLDGEPAEPSTHCRAERRPSPGRERHARPGGASRRRWCLPLSAACHEYGMWMPRSGSGGMAPTDNAAFRLALWRVETVGSRPTLGFGRGIAARAGSSSLKLRAGPGFVPPNPRATRSPGRSASARRRLTARARRPARRRR